MLRKNLIKYGLALVIAGAMTVGYLLGHGYTPDLPDLDRYMMLCDAFTIPGLTLIMVAALVALSNEGSFTAVGYAVRYAIRRLIPGPGGRQETYAEYVERKTGQERIRGYGFLFHVGLAFFAVAMVYLVLFFRLDGA